MKLGILSITALLVSVGLATPVRADVQCRGANAVSICLDETNWRSYRLADYDRDYNAGYDNDHYADINQIYQEVLGRNVDRSGLRTYGRNLDRGQSLEDIRADIANSHEARDLVDRMYRERVGRSADRSTLKNYTRRLGKGSTLNDIRADIEDSDGFRTRRGSGDFPSAPPAPGGNGNVPSAPPAPGGFGNVPSVPSAPPAPGGFGNVPPAPPPPGRP